MSGLPENPQPSHDDTWADAEAPSPAETPSPGSSLMLSADAATPALTRLADTARGYAEARSSSNTRKAYASDWTQFSRWCRRKGFDVSEPRAEVVGLFLAASASGDGTPKAAVSTIERRLAAITTTYRSAGTPLPRQDRHIMDVMAGIRRLHARPPKQKEALFAEDILAMCATLPNNLRGYRDRAILLVGFAGGLRRSEISGLDCAPEQTKDGGGWIEILEDGALLTIRGKTGWRTVEIGRGSRPGSCPVQALETWLKLGRIGHGPVFRRVLNTNTRVGADRLDDKHVARLVQATALKAAIRSDLPEAKRKALFAGHSLRAGLASSAEVDEAHVQRQLGHASVDMTRRYQRRKERFKVNLTKAAGL
jgi:integrase